jgi:hypothetical protein
MKKILFTTAIISLLFAGCNKDKKPNGHEVKKLPSKMVNNYSVVSKEGNSIHTWSGRDTMIFEYDNINRLVNFRENNYNTEITYNVHNNPVRIIANEYNIYDNSTSFHYNGNQIVAIKTHIYSSGYRDTINIDTLTVNEHGQLVEMVSKYDYIDFTYNSDGDIIKYVITGEIQIDKDGVERTERIYTLNYSNAKSIWRHVNMPSWFNTYLFFWIELGIFGSKYMFSEYNGTRGVERVLVANGLDTDDYVRQTDADVFFDYGYSTWEASHRITIEYVSAK